MNDVRIYTDGACSGNPGPGGWGALIRFRRNRKIVLEQEIFGGAEFTDNLTMELTAVVEALDTLEEPGTKVLLVTDSLSYVIHGWSQLPAWRRENWRRSKNKPLVHADLWRRADILGSKHRVKLLWTKAHALNTTDIHSVGNARADRLAKRGKASQIALHDLPRTGHHRPA